MWDTPFDESMLGLKQGVVIRCPEEHLAWELFEIFEQNGIGENWKREDWNPDWGSYREETAYFVKGKKLLYGPKVHAEQHGYSYTSYAKCTFFGDIAPDFEAASDRELLDFLGIGGAK